MLKTVDLNGRRALITGAGSGIGRAIALRLAEEGMKLALVGRSADKLMRTAAMTGRPLDMLVLPTDITTARGIDDIMRIMEGHFKGLDVLVNNAGRALNCPFEQITNEDFDAIMALNVRAPFVLCRRSLKLLRTSECPTIVNIGSVAGVYGIDYFVDYSATKGAIISFTKALAKAVTGKGITVNCISPGSIIDTTIDNNLFPEFSFTGRAGTPTEIANAVLFVASDEASYLSGQNIQVDGCRKKM
jgi:3-oxoacyl-[acyl-carrier protein] reductase